MVTVDLSTYPPDVIRKAFWLQQKIKEEGTPAVRFMARAERRLEREAPDIVAKHIDLQLKRL